MRRALALAERGRGFTSPNPTVGAVLVRDGEVVGEGYHHAAGLAHAEVEALRSAGNRARGATLYVTLEPCCHHGRTPPCTHSVIWSGVSRVVAGVLDPNPRVAGKGVRTLRAAGVTVDVGICEQECRRINLPFFLRVTTGFPMVTLKAATSLDGRIATRSGHSRWITGEAARQDVHRLRGWADAVVIGVGTALADDPQLSCRLEGLAVCQPRRVVLDSRGRLPLTAQLVKTACRQPTIVYTTYTSPSDWREALTSAGVAVVAVPQGADGCDLRTVLTDLSIHGANDVLVEGGQRVFASFLSAGLVHRIMVYVAPVVIGGKDAPAAFTAPVAESMEHALRLRSVDIQRLGDDVRIEGWLIEPDSVGKTDDQMP